MGCRDDLGDPVYRDGRWFDSTPDYWATDGRDMTIQDHCFREDICQQHPSHQGDDCCCCGQPPEAHEGCDCE